MMQAQVLGEAEALRVSKPVVRSVLRHFFDAQTLLISTLDQDPEALTVAEQTIVGRITGGNIAALTVAQMLALLGYTHPLANTFVSATGAAGTDGTAMDVKTVVVPANSLTQVNDRLRIRTYWMGTTGGAVTATTKLNTVTVAAATDAGGASFFTTEASLHYIDNTHANLIESGSYPATGSNSAANVAGFDWASDQNVVVSQDSVGNNHIVVYCIFLDVMPLGVM